MNCIHCQMSTIDLAVDKASPWVSLSFQQVPWSLLSPLSKSISLKMAEQSPVPHSYPPHIEKSGSFLEALETAYG